MSDFDDHGWDSEELITHLLRQAAGPYPDVEASLIGVGRRARRLRRRRAVGAMTMSTVLASVGLMIAHANRPGSTSIETNSKVGTEIVVSTTSPQTLPTSALILTSGSTTSTTSAAETTTTSPTEPATEAAPATDAETTADTLASVAETPNAGLTTTGGARKSGGTPKTTATKTTKSTTTTGASTSPALGPILPLPTYPTTAPAGTTTTTARSTTEPRSTTTDPHPSTTPPNQQDSASASCGGGDVEASLTNGIVSIVTRPQGSYKTGSSPNFTVSFTSGSLKCVIKSSVNDGNLTLTVS